MVATPIAFLVNSPDSCMPSSKDPVSGPLSNLLTAHKPILTCQDPDYPKGPTTSRNTARNVLPTQDGTEPSPPLFWMLCSCYYN